jgi:2,3-bisphosphoglycerate-independent phosphoglycerate mutase
VGLGDDDPARNPLAAASTPAFEALLGARLTRALPTVSEPDLTVRALDATLGHAGLPQSATGQTALLTGRNAATLMRGHYGPYPGPTLRALLDGGTLFSEVGEGEGTVRFANAYPPGFFAALERGRRRLNVPTYAALAAGLRLATLEDYLRGEGVSADLDGAYLARFAPRVPLLKPEAAGEQLAALAQRATLTFFDFWLTDAAGHRWPFEEAVALAERLDRFVAGVLAALGEVTLLIVSDHGNFEDKNVKSHTRNPVPLVAVGPGAQGFAGCSSLLDVAPSVRRLLALGAPGEHRDQA